MDQKRVETPEVPSVEEENTPIASLHRTISALENRLATLESLNARLQKGKNRPKEGTSEQESDTNDLTEGVRVAYQVMKDSGTGDYTKEYGKPPSLIEESKSDLRSAEQVMTFIPYISSEGVQTKVEVKIYSTRLRDMIRMTMHALIEHESSTTWNENIVTIKTANALVIHSWNDLWATTENEEVDEETRRELRCFLKHIRRYESGIIQAREEAIKEGQIVFKDVWTLFPPGSEVIALSFKNSPQIFTVGTNKPEANSVVISCSGYDWDGRDLIRNSYDFEIKEYTGVKRIGANDNGKTLRETLAIRGKKFREYCIRLPCDAPQLSCNNYMIRQPTKRSVLMELLGVENATTNSGADKGEDQKDAGVIVDHILYKRYSTSSALDLGCLVPESLKVCKCSLCDFEGKRQKWSVRFKDPGIPHNKTCSEDPKLNEILYSQLPPRLLGYVLDRKEWGQFHVDSIKEEHKDCDQGTRGYTSSWANLNLDEEHKEIIQKLVRSHMTTRADDRRRIRDLIPGKGDGLVLLLHGIPGVGKTMTAEALAREIGRRLLRIDASDFEYKSTGQVSHVFKRFFNMAHSWQTLLLLDEADVFLQLRRRAEIEQNALVAVLLRELEYFPGILIMTTNRVLTIDNAVQSRINYSVRFRQLDIDSTRKIWKTFQKQLNDSNCLPAEKRKIEEYFSKSSSIKELLRWGFTGRDIRNIFITAQLLGYPHITMENLEAVIFSTGGFRDELKDVSRTTEIQNAGIDP